MVQKFANDSDENKFFSVWEALLQQTFADLEDWFENIYKTPELGNALHNAQAIDVWKILEKSFFVKIYPTLIESGFTAGAVDTYCNVIYALFGESTEITVSIDNPMEVTIGVVAEYSNFTNWITRIGNVMLTRDGSRIIFRTLLTDIPKSQLSSLIRAITNAGTKINVNLNVS